MQVRASKDFWGNKPGFDFGDILHIGVNLVFVSLVYLLSSSWNLPILAGLLVLMGKWRVFAVQPRFWLPNIKANLVDIVVGLSTVILINTAYSDQGSVWLQIFWAVLYAVWVLYIKPKQDTSYVNLQAFWAQTVGLFSIFIPQSLIENSVLIMILVFLICWSSARHFFSTYDQVGYKKLAMIWGLLSVELAWFMMHWIQYYDIGGFKISVYSLVVSVISVGLGTVYSAYKSDRATKAVITENIVFAGGLLLAILVTAGWSARV